MAINHSLCSLVAFFVLWGCGSSKEDLAPPKTEPLFQPVSGSKACGPNGSFVATLIPETWTGFCGRRVARVQFTNAWVTHDNCYSTIGTTKQICDQTFLDHLNAQCGFVYKDTDCSESRKACYSISKAYFKQVDEKGQSAFDKGQTPPPTTETQSLLTGEAFELEASRENKEILL